MLRNDRPSSTDRMVRAVGGPSPRPASLPLAGANWRRGGRFLSCAARAAPPARVILEVPMFPNKLAPLAVAIVALGTTFPGSTVRPDEGMWPFDALPREVLKTKYGFEPTDAWLEHVRLGSVRFNTGGSGSFVSPDGLVMTNHHVALTTIHRISTPEKDWVVPGFSARLYGGEVKVNEPRPGETAEQVEENRLELRQLVDIRDVTKEVLEARAADATPEGNEWRAKVEQMTAAASDPAKHLVADLVPLYDGNQYRIHVYRVFDDVRLVFAPEKQVAFYGGDLDNFTYPRWCLDCAFFRVYEDGKPVDSSKWYFPFDADGAQVDELVFVSGHPGGTDRSLTHAEMELHRDLLVPNIVRLLEGRVAAMKRRMDADPEAAFALRDQYFGATNSLKAYTGHLAGLLDAKWMERIRQRDEELIKRAGKPEVEQAFAFVAEQMGELREKHAQRVDLRTLMPQLQQVQAQTCADAKKTINQARFDVHGTANYPDAGFTLRLAFGTVRGYEAGTTLVPPKTTINGLYERNAAFDDRPPFDLPAQWKEKKGKLKLDTPFNFVCTADIIGGNSGSPILDREAKVVGLVFDGNIESLPSNYWYDEKVNRCVGVHTAVMLEALAVIYEEHELLKELTGGK